MKNSFIQPLSLVLPATDGQATFLSVFGNNLALDEGCEHLGAYISSSTRATEFEVCQLDNKEGFKDGDIFDGDNVVLKKLSFTPAQAGALALCSRREFGEKHFVLLVEADGKFFVAYIYLRDHGIGAHIRKPSDDHFWYQKDLRIVLPKQDPLVT